MLYKDHSQVSITNFQEADKYEIFFIKCILKNRIYYIPMSDFKILNKCYRIKCCNLCWQSPTFWAWNDRQINVSCFGSQVLNFPIGHSKKRPVGADFFGVWFTRCNVFLRQENKKRGYTQTHARTQTHTHTHTCKLRSQWCLEKSAVVCNGQMKFTLSRLLELYWLHNAEYSTKFTISNVEF